MERSQCVRTVQPNLVYEAKSVGLRFGSFYVGLSNVSVE